MLTIEYAEPYRDKIMIAEVTKVRGLIRNFDVSEFEAGYNCNLGTETHVFALKEPIEFIYGILEKYLINSRLSYRLKSERGSQISFCHYCGGSGKKDWVMNARDAEKVVGSIAFLPKNTPKVKILSDGRIYKAQYLPELIEDESYCRQCGATGIQFRNFHKVFLDTLWIDVPPHSTLLRPL